MSRRKKSDLAPMQLCLDLLEGTKVLIHMNLRADDRSRLAEVLREMARIIDVTVDRELDASDLRTILKLSEN